MRVRYRNAVTALVVLSVALGAWLLVAGGASPQGRAAGAEPRIPGEPKPLLARVLDFESGWTATDGERALPARGGTTALRVSTNAGSGQAVASLPPQDWSATSLRLRLRSPDWDAVRGLFLTARTGSGVARAQLVPLLPSLRPGEWTTVTLGRSDFAGDGEHLRAGDAGADGLGQIVLAFERLNGRDLLCRLLRPSH